MVDDSTFVSLLTRLSDRGEGDMASEKTNDNPFSDFESVVLLHGILFAEVYFPMIFEATIFR